MPSSSFIDKLRFVCLEMHTKIELILNVSAKKIKKKTFIKLIRFWHEKKMK
jgi:hypothetical protein